MDIKNFDELKSRLASFTTKKRLAVVAAQDEHTLEAVTQAASNGLVFPVLIGDKEKIEALLERFCFPVDSAEIIPAESDEAAAIRAAQMVHSGEVDCIMKGRLETGTLMRVLVGREHGIRTGGTMSMFALMHSPHYHKLFAITDVGLTLKPTLEQKRDEIINAVAAFHKLGIEQPKVAVLCAVEKVNPKMPETVEAAQLKEMGIPGCIVEGPISYDLAMDPEAARIKGYNSPVAGDADILIVPDIVSGNIAAKSLTCCGGAGTCGAVLGALAPIIITSRSASAEDKYMSIVLSALIS